MTAPTLTYGNQFLDDCLDTSLYAETESSLVCALTADPEDVFVLTGTCNDAGDEYAYYERDITNFSTTTDATKWLARYKTSAGSAALGARVDVIFTAGSQSLLEASAIPQFNTGWTIASGTLTAGKTVDKIRFYADDYPNTVAAGASSVYYDFIMFYEGTLTFPHVSKINNTGGLFAEFGNKIGKIPVNGRDTDILQKAGRKNTVFTLRGDMINDEAATWGTPYGLPLIKALDDEWCWFTCDTAEMKVLVKDFKPSQDASNVSQTDYDLVLEEFSYSDKSDAQWGRKGWLGK